MMNKKTVGTFLCGVLLTVILHWPMGVFAQGPTAHDIKLTWSLSTSSSVTAQKVYRGTVSGGPYTLISTLGTTTTTFMDTTGTGGTKYFYVLTALAGTNESAPSTEVSATFLSNPQAQTGLGAVAE